MAAQTDFEPSLAVRKEDIEKPASGQVEIPPLSDGLAVAFPLILHVINEVKDREPPTCIHSNLMGLFATPMSEERRQASLVHFRRTSLGVELLACGTHNLFDTEPVSEVLWLGQPSEHPKIDRSHHSADS
jgi:hypothetical protein